MRGALIALALAAAAPAFGQQGAASPPAKRDKASVEAWLKANLKSDGYRVVYADDRAVTLFHFVTIQDVEGEVVRGWVREEYLDPSAADRDYRSTDTLYDFDCSNMRLRATAQDRYGGLNRSGADRGRDDLQSPVWAYARLDSVEEYLLEAACADQIAALERLIEVAKADNAKAQAERNQAADAAAAGVRP